MAEAAGCSPSATVSAIYTIAYPAETAPTFSPAGGGTYTSDPKVILSSGNGSTIYYTMDGSQPKTSSSYVMSGGTITVTNIGIPAIVTVNAMAEATECAPSSVSSAEYTLAYPAATPSFNPVSGTNSIDVSLSCATPDATIYYTTNGSTHARKYTGSPISVVGNGTVETIDAYATAAGYSNSSVASETYTIP